MFKIVWNTNNVNFAPGKTAEAAIAHLQRFIDVPVNVVSAVRA